MTVYDATPLRTNRTYINVYINWLYLVRDYLSVSFKNEKKYYSGNRAPGTVYLSTDVKGRNFFQGSVSVKRKFEKPRSPHICA